MPLWRETPEGLISATVHEHTASVSLWLIALAAIAMLIAGLIVGVPWFFNRLSPTVDGRRRARNDGYFVSDQCATGLLSRYRRLNRRLPSDPRCKFCLVPFGGIGRALRVRPSRKNPNFCMGCFEMAPIGGSDMDVGVLFADLRGFTAWCEDQPPSEVERALNRFYSVTARIITDADGLVDKLVGDEVMGLFLTAFRSLGERTCEVMVGVAEQIVHELHGQNPLPVAVGVNFGTARVGNVGVGDVKDFTAVGDVVNTAARLQSSASGGEVVMSEVVYHHVRETYPELSMLELTLKGKTDSVLGRVLNVNSAEKDPWRRTVGAEGLEPPTSSL
jgi:adenylate cyclase